MADRNGPIVVRTEDGDGETGRRGGGFDEMR